MFKGKFRKYLTPLLPSTEPLSGGCRPTKAAFEILDYCDEHGLSRTKATFIDDNGDLHLKDNCHAFKLPQREKLQSELFFEMVADPKVYDNPARLAEVKRLLETQEVQNV